MSNRRSNQIQPHTRLIPLPDSLLHDTNTGQSSSCLHPAFQSCPLPTHPLRRLSVSWCSFSAWSHFPLQIESNPSSLLWPMGGPMRPSPSQPHPWPYSPSAYQTQRPNFRTSNKSSSFSNSNHCICYSLGLENLSVHVPRLTIPARPSLMTQCEKALCFSLCTLSFSFPALSTMSN